MPSCAIRPVTDTVVPGSALPKEMQRSTKNRGTSSTADTGLVVVQPLVNEADDSMCCLSLAHT